MKQFLLGRGISPDGQKSLVDTRYYDRWFLKTPYEIQRRALSEWNRYRNLIMGVR